MSEYQHPTVESKMDVVDVTDAPSPVDVQVARTYKVTAEDLLPQREGILKDVRTKSGDIVMGEITPDCRVIYRGVAMSVDFALKEGILAKDANGQIVDATAAYSGEKQKSEEEKAKEAEQQEAEEAKFPVEMDEKTKSLVGEFHDFVESMGVAPRDAVLAFMNDPLSYHKIYSERFAKALNAGAVEEGDKQVTAANLTEAMVELYEQGRAQVESLAKQMGVDMGELDLWFDRHQPRVKAAALELLDGNARPFRALIKAFQQSNPMHKRPATKAEVKGRIVKRADGKEVRVIKVRLPGGKEIEVSEANARMQGWI